MLTIIIIIQDYFIRHTSQSIKDMISKIIKSILTIFSNLIFDTKPKILIIFGIIYYTMILFIS